MFRPPTVDIYKQQPDYVYNSYVNSSLILSTIAVWLCLQQLCKQLSGCVYNSYVNSSPIMSTTAM